MPAFVHPALLWGLGLIAVPILIHLINLWRHRRVPWAAMEFLLESKKKNQRWIVLRQFLLLLARMAVIAALVLVLAQPLLKNRLGDLVGSAKTHHILLLDDSFSMSDRIGQTTAFQQARRAIVGIANRTSAAGGVQDLTLLRFSRAGDKDTPARPDMYAAQANSALEKQLAAALEKMAPSQTNAGPLAAVESVARLLSDAPGDRSVLYLVSDFRANEWGHAEALRAALAKWTATGVEIHFVHCVSELHDNLAISGVRPQRGILAAGVPFFIEITAQNYGRETARNVAVSVSEDGHSRPALVIDEIGPGEAETRRVLVNFPSPGDHVVNASLEPDCVLIDNSRSAVVQLPAGLPVLVVDGSAEAADARFLSLALAPGGSIRTGIDVEIQPPRYLVDHPLAGYRAIYFTNAANLEESAVSALESYVRSGGGLAIFLGEASDSRFINERLYRSGQGLFPLEIASPTQLFVDNVEAGPDLVVTDHPIFKVFSGQRNSFLNSVEIERFFTVTKQAELEAGNSVAVLARLRTGAPLVMEKRFGEGRVIAFLTTAAPTWNNWGRNPSFVVAMLEMQSYLLNHGQPLPEHMVGEPLRIEFPASRYQSRLSFTAPSDSEEIVVTGEAKRVGDNFVGSLTDTDGAGTYTIELTTPDGRTETRRYAVNVAPREGNLDLVTTDQLAANLPDLKFANHRAEDLDWTISSLAGFNLSDGILYLLIVLMVGEQLLAYRNTYHPPAKEGRT